jgi:hypothetical protein
MDPESNEKLDHALISRWLYTKRHMQLIHNLVTDRYGWFVEETGEIEGWYADKETALAAPHSE